MVHPTKKGVKSEQGESVSFPSWMSRVRIPLPAPNDPKPSQDLEEAIPPADSGSFASDRPSGGFSPILSSHSEGDGRDLFDRQAKAIRCAKHLTKAQRRELLKAHWRGGSVLHGDGTPKTWRVLVSLGLAVDLDGRTMARHFPPRVRWHLTTKGIEVAAVLARAAERLHRLGVTG